MPGRMKRSSKVAVLGAVLAGLVILFFYAPVIQTTSQYGPLWYVNDKNGPSALGYESLGCVVFGFGDAYYIGNVTLGLNEAPVMGLVFSCQGPLPVL